MRILIVDDEPPAIRLLSGYVERTEGMEVSATFIDPIKALRFLRRESVDLVLLDIQMPELNGMQFARIVGNEVPVILTTAYDRYAVESYELRVVDYLLKPISYDRFLLAMERVAGNAGATGQRTRPNSPSPGFFFVKVGHQRQRVDYDDLTYLAGNGDYVTLYLATGTKLLTLENLTDLVDRLPADRFLRIHRSFAVALDKIEYLERNRVKIGQELLPVSESYRETLWERVGRP